MMANVGLSLASENECPSILGLILTCGRVDSRTDGSLNGASESYNEAGTQVQVKDANSGDGNILGYILQIELGL